MCVCARPPPALALASGRVVVCVWRVDAFSIVRQSKERSVGPYYALSVCSRRSLRAGLHGRPHGHMPTVQRANVNMAFIDTL